MSDEEVSQAVGVGVWIWNVWGFECMGRESALWRLGMKMEMEMRWRGEGEEEMQIDGTWRPDRDHLATRDPIDARADPTRDPVHAVPNIGPVG
jgi:hypothetical protein